MSKTAEMGKLFGPKKFDSKLKIFVSFSSGIESLLVRFDSTRIRTVGTPLLRSLCTPLPRVFL